MTCALLALLLAAAGDPPPVLAPNPAPRTLVQNRMLVKEGNWFFSGNLAYLSRGDFYDSPGLGLAAAYWPRESIGVELRLTQFFSSMTSSASNVFTQTGIKPDAQMPGTRLVAGVRHSLAYGKVSAGESVLHFDFQIAGHLGTLVTDQATTPALDVAASVLARISPRWFLQLDATVEANVESRVRSSGFSLGFLPELAVGVSL
jgi:outer membrane beta-barrel protein